MAEDPEREQRVRLFVALELPVEVREGIAAWGKRELRDPALRPVAMESLHITFAFLGHRDEAEVEPIAGVVEASGGIVPQIQLGEPEPRPGRGPPRVFALPARSEGAETLQAGLVERLEGAGLFAAEKRPFWPHVTVARVRTEGGGKRRPMAVAMRPGPLPKSLLEPFFGVRIALYRSELKPRGARYVPLAHVELSASGRQ
jgi:2'-5' RNA ligase